MPGRGLVGRAVGPVATVPTGMVGAGAAAGRRADGVEGADAGGRGGMDVLAASGGGPLNEDVDEGVDEGIPR